MFIWGEFIFVLPHTGIQKQDVENGKKNELHKTILAPQKNERTSKESGGIDEYKQGKKIGSEGDKIGEA